MRTVRHPEVPTLGPHRLGVFTRTEALAAGWTDEMLACAVRRGTVLRLLVGVYAQVPATDSTHGASAQRNFAMMAVAASLVLRSATVSHLAAAAAAGLPVWRVPSRPCVTVRPHFTGDSAVAHLHRARLPASHVLVNPLRRTRSARSVVDVAREVGIEDAVVVGDAALRRGMIQAGELDAVARLCGTWPGTRRIGPVLQLLDARAESPLESVSRVRLGGLGLPPVEPQVEIMSTEGHVMGRVDFYLDDVGVAGEVDGNVKYADDPFSAVMSERRRQGRMEDLGLVFVRWGRADLDDIDRLESRIRNAGRRGLRPGDSRRAWLARRTLAPSFRRSEVG